MGAGAFLRAQGATGAAANAVWFGDVPDRLNVLRAYHPDVALPQGIFDTQVAADYANRWTIWNTTFGGGPNAPSGSFGGFTTAPDGTVNTAQKFVESTGNTPHIASTGWYGGGIVNEFGRLKLAGFFKSTERRVILSIEGPTAGVTAGFFPNGQNGCKAIFDLAGGQIALDSTLFGSATARFVAYPAEMISYGNGWYLCSVEAFVQNAFPALVPGAGNCYCWITLDNGTGTNPESSTYAGDGTSGVFGWRTNLMPTRAYALNSPSLFEDFDDLSSIDVSNSRVEGFKFYLGNPWPVLPGDRNPSSSIFSTSSSILTMATWGPAGTSIPTLSIQTVTCSTGLYPASLPSSLGGSNFPAPTDVIGTAYKLPMLHEFRCSWPYINDYSFASNTNAGWAWTADWLAQQPIFCAPEFFGGSSVQGERQVGLMGREIDFMESFGGGGGDSTTPKGCYILYDMTKPSTATNLGFQGANPGNQTSIVGYPPWGPRKQYPNAFTVEHNGSFYTSTGTSFGSSMEPPSASWLAYTGPPTPVKCDLDNVLNTYAFLMLPATADDYGMAIQFFNGIFASWVASYKTDGVESRFIVTDGNPYSLNYGPGTTSSANLVINIDWIRITQ